MSITTGNRTRLATGKINATGSDGNRMAGFLARGGGITSGGKLNKLYTAGCFEVIAARAVLAPLGVVPLAGTARLLRAA